jgi:hypothetical protein
VIHERNSSDALSNYGSLVTKGGGGGRQDEASALAAGLDFASVIACWTVRVLVRTSGACAGSISCTFWLGVYWLAALLVDAFWPNDMLAT